MVNVEAGDTPTEGERLMRMGARLIEVSIKPRCDYYTITIKGKVRKPKPTQARLT